MTEQTRLPRLQGKTSPKEKGASKLGRPNIVSKPLSQKDRSTWWKDSHNTKPTSPICKVAAGEKNNTPNAEIEPLENDTGEKLKEKSMAESSTTGAQLSVDSKAWDQPLSRFICNVQQIHACFSDAIFQVERSQRKKLARVFQKVQRSFLQQFENILVYIASLQERYKHLIADQDCRKETRIQQLEEENAELRSKLERTIALKDAKVSLYQLEKRRADGLELQLAKQTS